MSSDEGELLCFEFDENEKMLGLRLSPECPPIVLAVKPDSAGERKGVPLKGSIHSINGHSLLSPDEAAELGDLMAALKVRPLTLMVAPPAAARQGPGGFNPPARSAKASSSTAPAVVDEGKAAAASTSQPEDDESDGDSSASDIQQDDRAAADLALLRQASPPEKPPKHSGGHQGKPDEDRAAADLALLKPASPPEKPVRHIKKAATSESSEGDDSGEDSADGGDGQAGDVSADRFDRDMGLLHKQHKRSSGGSPPVSQPTSHPTSPSQQAQNAGQKTAAQKQCEDDEALARALQEELDSEVAHAAAPEQGGHAEVTQAEEEDLEEEEEEEEEEVHRDPCVQPESTLQDDEELARLLQAEFDSEAAAHQLEREERMRATTSQDMNELLSEQEALVKHGRVCAEAKQTDTPEKPAPREIANPFGNLLLEPVVRLHDDATWAHRQRKFATTGAQCMKVGRNGKAYKRTFHLLEGYLRTDGKGTTHIPVTALTGIFRGNRSEEFAKMSSNRSSFSLMRRSAQANIEPKCCCVLTTQDRTFSLYFETSFSCDEFVETLAWYTTRLASSPWA